jgi:hypothetical protein
MVIILNNQNYNFNLTPVATYGFDLQGANSLQLSWAADVTYANLKQEC